MMQCDNGTRLMSRGGFMCVISLVYSVEKHEDQ